MFVVVVAGVVFVGVVVARLVVVEGFLFPSVASVVVLRVVG